jgi:hypothetical protein
MPRGSCHCSAPPVVCPCMHCACRSMPEDAAQRCSDGTCWVSVTQVFPRAGNKLYGAFSSRQQFIKALLASCHLPRCGKLYSLISGLLPMLMSRVL